MEPFIRLCRTLESFFWSDATASQHWKQIGQSDCNGTDGGLDDASLVLGGNHHASFTLWLVGKSVCQNFLACFPGACMSLAVMLILALRNFPCHALEL